jgi:hypothetical protein
MPSHVDSLHELAQAAFEPPKRQRRGPSRYIRKALVFVGRLSPEEYKAHKPRDQWDRIAMSLLDRACDPKKATSVAAFAMVREALGEKTSVLGMKTPDKVKPESEPIFNDAVPFAIRKTV